MTSPKRPTTCLRPPIRVLLRTVVGLTLLAVGSAMAQAWPNRPVHVVAPFPPGGPSDTAGRLVAARLGEALGQPFIIENKPGASGAIGSLAVARAVPDGYTLLMGATSSHIAPYLLKTQSYDPNKDLVPIVNLGMMPFYLMVHSATGARSLPEFIALGRAQPGKFSYGSPGNGTLAHLCMEMFKTQARVERLHVPYKGSAQVVSDLMAGHVNMTCNVTPTKAEQLRNLAVTAARRSPAMPDVPTAQEAGLPNFELALWVGLFGPVGLPAPIVERLNREINRILAGADMQDQLRTLNIEYQPNSAAQFAEFLRTDTPRWGKVIRDIGVKVD